MSTTKKNETEGQSRTTRENSDSHGESKSKSKRGSEDPKMRGTKSEEEIDLPSRSAPKKSPINPQADKSRVKKAS